VSFSSPSDLFDLRRRLMDAWSRYATGPGETGTGARFNLFNLGGGGGLERFAACQSEKVSLQMRAGC